jgi:glycerol-3-phosphate dehydrogenase (NAD(P)+)
MKKDFWSKSTIAVIGGGQWGTLLAQSVAAKQSQLQTTAQVLLIFRDEEQVKVVNSTKSHPVVHPTLKLDSKILACTGYDVFKSRTIDALLWALPAQVSRMNAKLLAPYLKGSEIIIHATKGLEFQTLKTISEVLQEELPCSRLGALSGPNLASEIAAGLPAKTVIGSRFEEVIEVGKILLESNQFSIESCFDIKGVEWCGALKNIYAIGAGLLHELKCGENVRATYLTQALREMKFLIEEMDGRPETLFLSCGVGDLLATCLSVDSRNFRVGQALARSQPLEDILIQLHSTAEGVATVMALHHWLKSHSPYSSTQLPLMNEISRWVLQGHFHPEDYPRFLASVILEAKK